MNLRLFFLVCFIWAAVSVAKKNKVATGLDTKVNKLKNGMVVLNTKMDKIIAVNTKVDGFDNGLAVLSKKTDRLIAGMGTNINSLNKRLAFLSTKWGRITGLHTKIKGLNKGMTVLNKKMDKLIVMPTPVGRDCADICQKGVFRSGVYKISPNKKTKFDVYCDMKTAGGGWTIFQKRVDGSVAFYRTWNEYKTGFGSAKKNVWLGNDKLHLLTHMTGRTQRLRVDLWDKKGNTRYAQYSKFVIGTETKKYTLTIGKYSGNAGDSLSYHNGGAFSTKDRDNSGRNCAVNYKGAWWYKGCHYSNLNGKYYNGKHKNDATGVNWLHWKGYGYSYPHTEMKIRPATFSRCKK